MDFFKILLTTHIICGGISLVLGLIIMLSKKGDKRHRLIGNIYFVTMLAAAVVAFPMSWMHPNYFLFIISVFTAYMLLSGKNYLKKKSIKDVKLYDWILTVTMLVFGLAFIAFGIYILIKANNFGIVLLVFGVISILFVYKDYQNFTGKSKIKNYWLTTHLQRMIGSYIASFTAFLVVNNTILPGMVAWLLPTIIMVPLIVKWSRKYQVEFKTAERI